MHWARAHGAVPRVPQQIVHPTTPLMLAVGSATMAAPPDTVEVDTALVEAMIVHGGARVDCAQANGDTALHIAAQNGNVAMVELLLRHGAPVAAAKLAHGETPLLLAAANGKTAAVRLLRP